MQLIKRSQRDKRLQIHETVHHDAEELLAGVRYFLRTPVVRAIECEQFLDHGSWDALHADESADHAEDDGGVEGDVAALGNHQLQAFEVQGAEVALAWLGLQKEIE